MVVHMLKEQQSDKVITRCNVFFNRRTAKKNRASIWWNQVTCEKCLDTYPAPKEIQDDPLIGA